MAININLLISAPVLQDYLVDKDTGTPLAAGVITFYKDSQRQILKNWYYQSSNTPPYTASSFSAGPNPMTLSGIGTFTDAQGNDIIPFFYPYDEDDPTIEEPYYVTVYSADGELQFTRANFPFVPSTPQPGENVPTLQNYIVNNEFWRNFGSANLSTPNSTTQINGTNYLYQTLAPSSHGGFSMPDMIILKDIAGATETLTFNTFNTGDQVLEDDITPEYYLDWNCSAFQAGQTLKCIQFPLQLHIEALSQVSATVAFHAKVNSGASNYQIVVQILQFTGTGQTNSQFLPIQTFTINTSWNKYITEPFLLPFADSLSIASTGDDALYVQFVFPATSDFDIFFAKPQLYLSDDIPTNQWDNYDQIDAVINTPRTGDIRTSLNTFQPFGWVPMNDGTIGNSSSNATTRANIDTWPLYSLLWNSFNPGLGLTSPIIPIFTSSSTLPYTPTTFGGTALADWDANKKIALTKMLGRALYGTAAGMPINISFSTNGTNTLTVTSGSLTNVYNGMPITIDTYTAANPPYLAITYYVKVISSTTFQLFYDPGLVNVVIIVSTGTGTAFLPDHLLGQFGGFNFGDTSGTYQISTGYPVEVTAGAAAIATRNPFTYMNFFMKL